MDIFNLFLQQKTQTYIIPDEGSLTSFLHVPIPDIEITTQGVYIQLVVQLQSPEPDSIDAQFLNATATEIAPV